MLFVFIFLLAVAGSLLAWAGFMWGILGILPLFVAVIWCDVRDVIRERRASEWRYKGDL